MTQSERRFFLIKELLAEQPQYAVLKIPENEQEQKEMLRSLMNVRLPKKSSKDFLEIQDEYLGEEIRNRGITDISSLTPIQEDIFLWQGDITTLRCDAIVNAAEGTTMYWASTYFSEVKNMTAEQASMLASLFYIGITVGRFLCGFITDKLGDRKMIILGTCILFCGVGLLMIPTDYLIIPQIGFIVIGFGCAPIYPCIIHSTPENFGEKNSGAIIGIQMASAYVGSTFIPPLFGFLGNLIGFEIMPIYLIVFFALMICMTECTFRITRKNPQRKAG